MLSPSDDGTVRERRSEPASDPAVGADTEGGAAEADRGPTQSSEGTVAGSGSGAPAVSPLPVTAIATRTAGERNAKK